MNSKNKTMAMIGLLLASVFQAGTAQAGTVENLERERAILVETLLDPALSPDDRREKIELSRQRLVDLERMVLRDDGLRGNDTPAVRRAFADYELTFLVHAAIERDRSVVEQWLERVGLTSQALLGGRVGRR